jgi:hypothetical protein
VHYIHEATIDAGTDHCLRPPVQLSGLIAFHAMELCESLHK